MSLNIFKNTQLDPEKALPGALLIPTSKEAVCFECSNTPLFSGFYKQKTKHGMRGIKLENKSFGSPRKIIFLGLDGRKYEGYSEDYYALPINSVSFKGLKFCITGVLPEGLTRDIVKDMVEALDGEFQTSVTNETTVLIQEGNNLRTISTKTKRAKQLGIPILTFSNFLKKYF